MYYLDVLDEMPDPEHTITIVLDGRTDSALDWNLPKQTAQRAIATGKKIIWEINLGLFSRLHAPFLDQTQFLSLCLSLQHFRDTLWNNFAENTVGTLLYRGPLAYKNAWKWSDGEIAALRGWLQDQFHDVQSFAEETTIKVSHWDAIHPHHLETHAEGHRLLHLHCRDAAAEYLELLSRHLPAELPVALFLDTHSISDPLLLVQLLAKDRYERFVRAVSHYDWLHPKDATIGLCMPLMTHIKPSQNKGLAQAMDSLLNQKIPFRIISEAYLTSEWHGLDHVWYCAAGLTPTGERKLRGFEAAGGTTQAVDETQNSAV